MARRINSYQETTLYHWDRWFDGAWWELEDGKDFVILPSSMRNQIYMAARRRGHKVRVRRDSKGKKFTIRAV